MQTITTISHKGQIVIPKPIRDKLNISPADKLSVDLVGDKILVTPAPTTQDMFAAFSPKKSFTQKEMKSTIKEAVIAKHKK